ncbi:MAG: bacteriohemerythrin [Patescibacteria group bacterium]
MTQLQWDVHLSVGINELDFHHKTMFSIISKLRTMSVGQIEAVALMPEIERLKKYSAFHLDREEDLFTQYNYPDAEKHRRQHQVYRLKIAELTADGLIVALPELIDFLEKWWIAHIMHEDKKYTDFFHQVGII